MVVLFDGKQSFKAYNLSEDLKVIKKEKVEENYRADYFDRLIQQVQHCSEKTIDSVADALADYVINIDPYEFYDRFGSFGNTAEDFFEVKSQVRKLLQDETEKEKIIKDIQSNKDFLCNDSLNEEFDVEDIPNDDWSWYNDDDIDEDDSEDYFDSDYWEDAKGYDRKESSRKDAELWDLEHGDEENKRINDIVNNTPDGQKLYIRSKNPYK